MLSHKTRFIESKTWKRPLGQLAAQSSKESNRHACHKKCILFWITNKEEWQKWLKGDRPGKTLERWGGGRSRLVNWICILEFNGGSNGTQMSIQILPVFLSLCLLNHHHCHWPWLFPVFTPLKVSFWNTCVLGPCSDQRHLFQVCAQSTNIVIHTDHPKPALPCPEHFVYAYKLSYTR